MSKRIWILVSVALVASLALALGVTVAMAQGGRSPNPNPIVTPQPGSTQRGPMGGGPGRGMMGGRGSMGGGMMGGRGMMGDGSLVDVAAEVLGIDRAQLATQMQTKSLAEISGDATKLQIVKDRFLAARRAWLQDLVANNRLTQDQANQMLQNMQTQLDTRLNTAGAAGPGPRGDMPEDCPMYQNGTCPGCGRGQPGQPGGGSDA